jgi:hypothetical protein
MQIEEISMDIPFDEMHICNKKFRLSEFNDNDCLQGRKLIPTDSSSINYYKNNIHQKSERKISVRNGRLLMLKILV